MNDIFKNYEKMQEKESKILKKTNEVACFNKY